MIRIGIAGGRGYVGEELLRLLTPMDEYQLVYAGSRSSAGKRVDEVFPDVESGLVFEDLSERSVLQAEVDAWIVAQPNGHAAKFAETVESKDVKLIDISSDFRFDDSWTYGLPEKNSIAIGQSNRVSNPGCYATAVQLALLPVIDRVIEMPVAFGLSGFSGAGRTPNDKNNPDRLSNNILPYSLAGHTHELEVSRHLGRSVRFLPHVVNFFRGISVTVNVRLTEDTNLDNVIQLYSDFYQENPLVFSSVEIPEVQTVAGSNRSLIGGFVMDERQPGNLAVISVIDNLRKGAASQAIQNLNLMFGMAASQGLIE